MFLDKETASLRIVHPNLSDIRESRRGRDPRVGLLLPLFGRSQGDLKVTSGSHACDPQGWAHAPGRGSFHCLVVFSFLEFEPENSKDVSSVKVTVTGAGGPLL